MGLNFSEIKSKLIYQFDSEPQMINAIKEVSQNFTTDRGSLEKYLADPALVAAYTAFYLPTNYAKVEGILSFLKNNHQLFHDAQVVDIGCGPGTYLLGLADQKQLKIKQLVGIEKSELMLKQAKEILSGYENVLLTQDANKVPHSDKRIVLFSHSLNEMGVEYAFKYLRLLNPIAVLFIEPGTKDVFSQLLEMRKKLLEQNFNVLYPCPSNASCPMSNGEDWCHQYFHAKHDPEIERLGQLTGIDRKWLPMSVHLYSKNEMSRGESILVRVKKPTKHSLEWQACELAESANKLLSLQLPKKQFSKAQIKDLEMLTSGNFIKYKEIKQLEENYLRVELV